MDKNKLISAIIALLLIGYGIWVLSHVGRGMENPGMLKGTIPDEEYRKLFTEFVRFCIRVPIAFLHILLGLITLKTRKTLYVLIILHPILFILCGGLRFFYWRDIIITALALAGILITRYTQQGAVRKG